MEAPYKGEPSTVGKAEDRAAIIPMNNAILPLPFFSFPLLFFLFFFFSLSSFSDPLPELAAFAEALWLYSHLLPFLQLPLA